jgi:hypothetical protein
VPTAMTFNSLLADVRAYLERGYVPDTTVFAQLPSLINLAERAIALRFKILGFLTPILTSGLRAGLSVYPKPNRWRQTVSMSYGTTPLGLQFLDTEVPQRLITEDNREIILEIGAAAQTKRVFLFARSLEFCQAYAEDASQTAPPQFYADYDYQHWLIAPTPDQDYPWAINAYLLPALLDTTNQTNWTTNYAPNALLYRTLLECTPFLKNDERIPVWQKLYEEQVSNLNEEDLQRVVDRTGVRNED